MLTRMLKTASPDQESENPLDRAASTGSNANFEEFNRKKKINVQTDIRAVGQLVLMLMKHTDLKNVRSEVTDELAAFVKSCSFNFKNWHSVAAHGFF